jgi:uncharacterized RDD family membrane protein YckC
MMQDSVREELVLKKTPLVKPEKKLPKINPAPPEKPVLRPPQRIAASFSTPPAEKVPALSDRKKEVSEIPVRREEPPVRQKAVTTKLAVKPTSPTLMEFQKKETAIPEWRLELKNAVRQKLRKDQLEGDDELFPAPRVINRTVGATALKPEIYQEEEAVPVLHENPVVQKALLRIEQSRQKFYTPVVTAFEENLEPEEPLETKPKKEFPYYIASRTSEVAAPSTETKPAVYPVTKPKLVSSLPGEGLRRDTNKLPPLPKPAKVSTSFERAFEPDAAETTEAEKDEIFIESTAAPEIKISPVKDEDAIEAEEEELEVNEDLAPVALRFNAGLFDLIIGGFASLILLAPFILLGGDWFTMAGLLAFLATCSIVMFIYMTTAVGLFGKTFGMRMFSLEVIDIEENEYPTFHQAAVSAAVYLLSLALGGTGFLTLLFTDEKRAVHDIVSGTLMVKDLQEEAE